MERIVDGMIREMVTIDEMQFAFVPGQGTTDAIFIIRQLLEKFLSRKDLNDKNLTLFVVDLEKALDRVPQKVLWQAMRKVGVEEWIVRLVQALQQCMQPSESWLWVQCGIWSRCWGPSGLCSQPSTFYTPQNEV